MALTFFNTMTRQKEVFKPIKSGFAGFYTCGPTVYNYAHIGNFRTYIFEDLLRRTLKRSGLKVKQVMNLTDVEDKIIRSCREQKITLKELTTKYSEAFLDDLKTLNVEPAEVYPLATETIDEMVVLIKQLMENGYAYKSDDGSIYYRISKFKDYGKLAHIDLSSLKTGVRVKMDEYEKEDAQDFALWKAWTEDDGDIFWETELGKGRPGWHIECSAMSIKNLGETFDIHTGAVDNIFPHHQNEIAQSEGATGKRFVNYWMHSEHLLVDGKKMAKSLGNFFTLRDIMDKGYNPKGLRYLLLSTHYRQQLNFTFESLDAAENTIIGLLDFIGRLKEYSERSDDNKDISKILKETKDAFWNAMYDDLDVSKALEAMFNLVSVTNRAIETKKFSIKNAQEVLSVMMDFDNVLGVLVSEEIVLTAEQKQLIKNRETARDEKNWDEADKIRDKLDELGIVIEDTGKGMRWKKKL